MLRSIVFLAIISVVYCKYEDCASYATCVKDIKQTNETSTWIIINYWQDRLQLDEDITTKLKTSVGQLNERISDGPIACKKHLLKLNQIQQYSNEVQRVCFGESASFDNPKEVEEYTRGRYTGSVEKLCNVYVKRLNENCEYLAKGIEAIRKCDVTRVFADLYGKPWEVCVKKSSA